MYWFYNDVDEEYDDFNDWPFDYCCSPIDQMFVEEHRKLLMQWKKDRQQNTSSVKGD